MNFMSMTDRTAITCKRCLASLAKRDRTFRAKARRWFAPRSRNVGTAAWPKYEGKTLRANPLIMAFDAATAVAVEMSAPQSIDREVFLARAGCADDVRAYNARSADPSTEWVDRAIAREGGRPL